MSVGLTFYCDVGDHNGTCPQSIHLQTTDLAAARAAVTRFGWQLSDTGDRCALYHAPKPKPPVPTRLTRRGDR